jgi:hypothetical protein
MISYENYKVMHLLGIALILLGLGMVMGGYANGKSISRQLRISAFASHGLGLLLALVGGFGMAARLGLVTGLPNWIYAKVIVWVLLGIGLSLAKRKAQWSPLLTFVFASLVAVAAGFAIWKPLI